MEKSATPQIEFHGGQVVKDCYVFDYFCATKIRKLNFIYYEKCYLIAFNKTFVILCSTFPIADLVKLFFEPTITTFAVCCQSEYIFDRVTV